MFTCTTGAAGSKGFQYCCQNYITVTERAEPLYMLAQTGARTLQRTLHYHHPHDHHHGYHHQHHRHHHHQITSITSISIIIIILVVVVTLSSILYRWYRAVFAVLYFRTLCQLFTARIVNSSMPQALDPMAGSLGLWGLTPHVESHTRKLN